MLLLTFSCKEGIRPSFRLVSFRPVAYVTHSLARPNRERARGERSELNKTTKKRLNVTKRDASFKQWQIAITHKKHVEEFFKYLKKEDDREMMFDLGLR